VVINILLYENRKQRLKKAAREWQRFA